MHHGIRNPRELKLRCYIAHMVDIDEYLSILLGGNTSDKIGETELNKILLNGMANGCRKKLCVQGFDFENIT